MKRVINLKSISLNNVLVSFDAARIVWSSDGTYKEWTIDLQGGNHVTIGETLPLSALDFEGHQYSGNAIAKTNNNYQGTGELHGFKE